MVCTDPPPLFFFLGSKVYHVSDFYSLVVILYSLGTFCYIFFKMEQPIDEGRGLIRRSHNDFY